MSKSRNKFHIPTFKPSNIPRYSKIVVEGQTGAGKTVTTFNLVEKIQAGIFIVICGNMSSYSSWEEIVDKSFLWPVFRGNDEQLNKTVRMLTELFAIQNESYRKLKEEYRAKYKDELEKNKYNRDYTPPKFVIPKSYEVCIVFDDIFLNDEWNKVKVLASIFSENRHLLLNVVVLIQYYTQLKKKYRDNIDLYLIRKAKSQKHMERLYNDYGSPEFSLSEFKTYFTACTKGMGRTLVIRCMGGDKIDERLCVYLSDDIVRVGKPLGSEAYQKFIEKYSKDDDEICKDTSQDKNYYNYTTGGDKNEPIKTFQLRKTNVKTYVDTEYDDSDEDVSESESGYY